MNKNPLIIGVVVIAVLVFGYIVISGQKNMEDDNISPALLPSPTSSLTPDEEAELEGMIEDHMGEHENDTIMAMAGRMTPAVFYASPGQVISLLNHEAEDLKIIADDGSFESPLATVEQEIITFYAPSTPGLYTYYSSISPNVKGTIVVEE